MIIYKIKNKINGKTYIGQTKYGLKKRIPSHMSVNFYIGKALRKYGLQSFIISIIDEAHIREILNEKEKYWIKFYDCKVPKGYNFTDGGDGIEGYNHTEETKRKIGKGNKGKASWRRGTGKIKSKPQSCLCGCNSITKAGNKYISGHNMRGVSPSNKGKHLSEELKQKISVSLMGRKLSEEHKKKLSIVRIGKPSGMLGKRYICSEGRKKKISKALIGKHHTEESKQKMRIIRTGKHHSEETKQKLREASTGKKHTKEAKQKISEAKKGKKFTQEHKAKLSAIWTTKRLQAMACELAI